MQSNFAKAGQHEPSCRVSANAIQLYQIYNTTLAKNVSRTVSNTAFFIFLLYPSHQLYNRCLQSTCKSTLWVKLSIDLAMFLDAPVFFMDRI